MATYVVLMGMQGAGKGTQAEVLAETLHLPHVTSGGMFRENISNGTPIGVEAKNYLDKGLLVPDELTIRMIKERLAKPDATNGVILDGFPRTVAQAEALNTLMNVTIVPYFVISKEEAMERLGGRLVCSKNDQHNGGYHKVNRPSKEEGICDVCGSPLIVRKDDTPEAIKKRIELYETETTPVLNYYREKGLLKEINAEQPVEAVTAELLAAIRALAV
jgi:adenylate kinase